MGQSLLREELEKGDFSLTDYLEELSASEKLTENLDKYDLSEFDCEIPQFVRKQASFWR